jgi:hypothetical protein
MFISYRTYLCEFEAEFEMALVRESGAQEGFFILKKLRAKNLVALSL